MKNNNTFFDELLDVPPVPEGVYSAVQTRIRRRTNLIRMTWAVIVSLILALGIFTFREERADSGLTVAEIQEIQRTKDIEEELQIVSDFINGSNIEEEISQYALVDLSSF